MIPEYSLCNQCEGNMDKILARVFTLGGMFEVCSPQCLTDLAIDLQGRSPEVWDSTDYNYGYSLGLKAGLDQARRALNSLDDPLASRRAPREP